LAATAIAALAVPAIASASAPPVTTLDSADYIAQTLPAGNYDVPAGNKVNLSWADVKGNLTVEGSVVNFGKTLYEKNVTVNKRGSFMAGNWPVTINGNLQITDPAANSQNGFWGDYWVDPTDPTGQIQDRPDLHLNEVKGNLIYTIDANGNYPQYQSPLPYFGGGTKVDGKFTYNTGGRMTQSPGDGLIAAPAAMGSLTTVGTTTIS